MHEFTKRVLSVAQGWVCSIGRRCRASHYKRVARTSEVCDDSRISPVLMRSRPGRCASLVKLKVFLVSHVYFLGRRHVVQSAAGSRE